MFFLGSICLGEPTTFVREKVSIYSETLKSKTRNMENILTVTLD